MRLTTQLLTVAASVLILSTSTAVANQFAFEDFDGGATGDAISTFRARGNSNTSLTVVDDSAGIGSGNALQFEPGRTTNTYMTGSFTEVDLAAEGDFIEFKFDIRLLSNVTSTQDFNFGLWNDGGTPVTADLQGNTGTTDDDFGYTFRVDTGAAVSETARVSAEFAGDTLHSGSVDYIDNGSLPAAALTTTPIEYSILMTRTAAGFLDIELSVDGVSSGVDHVTDGTETLTTVFNQFSFGSNGTEIDFLIDNLSLSSNVIATGQIPEPAGLSLALASAFALLGRRRRR